MTILKTVILNIEWHPSVVVTDRNARALLMVLHSIDKFNCFRIPLHARMMKKGWLIK